MFKKKAKKDDNEKIKDTQVEKVSPHEKPLICLFDTDEDVSKLLTTSQFKCEMATAGTCVRVPNTQRHSEHFLLPNYQSPANLHEFDIAIFDMTKEKVIDYNSNDYSIDQTKGKKAHALLSKYPQTIFDPRPFSIYLISREITKILEKQSVIICFCSQEETIS